MRRGVIISVFVILMLIGISTFSGQSAPQTQALFSPLSTPVMINTPTSTEASPATYSLSLEAQQALAYVAQKDRLALNDLAVINEFRRESVIMDRAYQAVTVLNSRNLQIYSVIVDVEDGAVVDRSSFEDKEEQLFQTKYGKLQPMLYERLQLLNANDTVMVTIWVTAPIGENLADLQTSAYQDLSDRYYAQVKNAIRSCGNPIDAKDPVLAERIYDEYVKIIDDKVASRIQPLVKYLDRLGKTVKTSQGLPSVTVALSKAELFVSLFHS